MILKSFPTLVIRWFCDPEVLYRCCQKAEGNEKTFFYKVRKWGDLRKYCKKALKKNKEPIINTTLPNHALAIEKSEPNLPFVFQPYMFCSPPTANSSPHSGIWKSWRTTGDCHHIPTGSPAEESTAAVKPAMGRLVSLKGDLWVQGQALHLWKESCYSTCKWIAIVTCHITAVVVMKKTMRLCFG